MFAVFRVVATWETKTNGGSALGRWARLAVTITVLLCGAFSVGHYVGSSSAAGAVSDCRAAVVAALDAERSAVGASERFVEYAGRCV